MPLIQGNNQLAALRWALIRLRNLWVSATLGVTMGREVRLSLSGRLNSRRRGSIRIGDRTLIAFKTLITSIDLVGGEDRPVRIGSHCFIGGGSVILPGVTIGDGSIVGAGAVVFDDVPERCAVAGNPAVILRRDLQSGPFGRLEGADENFRRRLVELSETS